MSSFINEILHGISQNVELAPFFMCGLLLLAGFNLPISEDLMIFSAALLAINNPDHVYQLYAGVFLGAYLSDLICYGLGRHFGPKLWNVKLFSSMVSKKRVDQLANFYGKYGIITLIIGRFIPFGVRNGLFLTAGLTKMNFAVFALSDLLACIISSVTLFSFTYHFGDIALKYIKEGNKIIFTFFALGILAFYLRSRKKKKSL